MKGLATTSAGLRCSLRERSTPQQQRQQQQTKEACWELLG